MSVTIIKEISTNEETTVALKEITRYVNKSWNCNVLLSGRWCCPKGQIKNLLRCGIVKDDNERFVWYCSDNDFNIMMTTEIFRYKRGGMSSGGVFFELYDGYDFNEPIYRVEIPNYKD